MFSYFKEMYGFLFNLDFKSVFLTVRIVLEGLHEIHKCEFYFYYNTKQKIAFIDVLHLNAVMYLFISFIYRQD